MASVRGQKRRRRRRRPMIPQPWETCYVCGRVGEARTFMDRGGERVCLDQKSCMDRVLLPQPQIRRHHDYTLAELEALRAVPQRYVMGMGESAQAAAEAMADLAAKFNEFQQLYGTAPDQLVIGEPANNE